ncbi:hypothetical protein CLU95_0919 [Variovorax sp. 54]|uniref:hypothetical protein n=1 Tax=Variovorax sp. 54 TaxID=2035212 RepID=UPI000C3B7D97|nr:hypothetical protein [Variovorax sp. 54]PIF73802.1 hypothetical protein CLU95_0919 [Variovorax sp. 54]
MIEHLRPDFQARERLLFEAAGPALVAVTRMSIGFDDKRLTFMKLLSGRSLRLGVHRLPAIERVVIQTTVRLSANQGNCRWKLVQEPPYDALLVDETGLDSLDESSRAASVILKLTRDASDLPNSLQRPIRAEKLQLLLRDLQQTLHEASTKRRLTSKKPVASDSARFMLRRWPANKLIANDPDKILLASLLMRYTLSARELAKLSKQSISRCTEFLHLLHQAGALNVHLVRSAEFKRERASESNSRWGVRLGVMGNWFNRIRCRWK